MSTPPSHVVVAFDFSPPSTAALRRAIALAARAPFHVLHVLHVIDPHVQGTERVDYELAERLQGDVTRAMAAELAGPEPVQFFVHVRIGNPAAEILATAREIGADLIIVGSHGTTGLQRLFVGSVAERVVREAGCTVEVARPKAYDHVELLRMTSVEPHHAYVPPHRYSYEDHRVTLRPIDWPLY